MKTLTEHIEYVDTWVEPVNGCFQKLLMSAQDAAVAMDAFNENNQ